MNYLLPQTMLKSSASLLIAIVLGLLGCTEDQTAGTSSTTGNPVKVGFGFKKDGAPSSFVGRVTFYPLSHMPVFDSLPLSTYAVSGDSFHLIKDSLEAILDRMPDTLRPKAGDTLFSFNVFLNSDDGRGAALLGVKYRLGKGFHKPAEWSPAGGGINVGLLSDYQGSVDVTPSDLLAYFIYLPGTPYYARLQNEQFVLKSLAAGSFEPFLLPVRTTRTAGNHPIVSQVQTLGGAIVPGETKAFSAGEVKDTLTVPDDWWFKNFGQ